MESIGRARRASDYAESYERWNGYRLRLAEFLGAHDLYMTPTLAQKPPRIGALATPPLAARLARLSLPLGLRRLIPLAARTVEQASLANLRGVPFTQLANVCGVPAMSVPLDRFDDGMPLGVQFLADHGGEGLLFSLAGQLERAAPWSERRPVL
jgi:amidase